MTDNRPHIWESFKWPYLGNESPDSLHVPVCMATVLCRCALYSTVDTFGDWKHFARDGIAGRPMVWS